MTKRHEIPRPGPKPKAPLRTDLPKQRVPPPAPVKHPVRSPTGNRRGR
ncbi:MAG TPA: hypothetical protein VL241_03360 [Gemmatimonadales bacterium]|nr:hypothetical protein [Gemmatimonadales bacterium]